MAGVPPLAKPAVGHEHANAQAARDGLHAAKGRLAAIGLRLAPILRMHARLPDDAGFSLVEALIASLLLAASVAGVMQLVSVAGVQARAAERRWSALLLAQDKLEELKTAATADLSPPDACLDDRHGFTERLSGGEVRRWAVTPVRPGDRTLLQLCVCIVADAAPSPVTCAAQWHLVQP